jgi:signal transduction histidine kinase
MTRAGKIPMTRDGTRRRLALASPRTATVLGVVVLVLWALSIPLAGLLHQLTILNIAPAIPFFLVYAAVGVVVARRQPRNPIGWILVIFVVLIALSTDGGYYAVAAFSPGHRGLPLAAVAVLLKPLWVPAAALFPLVILLFPDGRLTSRRWRWVLWAYVGLFACMMAVIFARTIAAVAGHHIRLDSSGDVTTAGPPAGAAASAATVLVLVSIGVICLSFVARQVLSWRRAAGERRQQLKWLASGSVITLVCSVIGSTASSAAVSVVILGAAALPVSIGVGILKYRLYDIDVVISRTIVYGLLAAFITAVYVGVVVGIGALGSGSVHAGSRPNLGLSILATAVVAVAFQPVRERVQHLANRLVFGKRATPYEALSEFAGRMAGTYAAEDILPRMARVLAEGTGADRAVVWLKDGAELAAGGCWPTEGESPGRVGFFAGGGAPDIAGADRVALVYYQGEALGALSVAKRPGENLTPVEGKLMSDLGAQAGLLLHNIGLTEQLRARLAELRASRLRIVTAQDEQRRRIERDIHDGAQQQLLAIASTLALAESVAGQDEQRERALVTQLKAETSGALKTLRELARGIYPPLLADQGLAAAVRAQAGKAPGPVEVSTDGVGRYPPEIETAIYFCCVEALQNAARHAPGSAVRVSLAQDGSEVAFTLADDGPGFDPAATTSGTGLRNMSDRLAALGGSCQVDSGPRRGTTITGRIRLDDQMAGNAGAVPLTGRMG